MSFLTTGPFAFRNGFVRIAAVLTGGFIVGWVAWAADTIPTDIKMPGTQPGELGGTTIGSVSNCGCHDFNSSAPDSPEADAAPAIGWIGGMMANAGRDPLFWATLAIAEQDFLPTEVWDALGAPPGQEGGVGDLCLKCHTPKGWTEGRSTPTNGAGMDPATDDEGVACELCHFMADPDADDSAPGVLGRNATYAEAQSPPFEAHDGILVCSPDDLNSGVACTLNSDCDRTSPGDGLGQCGQGYYGGAEYVLNSTGDRSGPFLADARHPWIENKFYREAAFCGTCHDVSNPAVGDLAPNHGVMAAFTGAFSGVPNGPVEDKAALNNPPSTYGVVERTYSEFLSSGLDDYPVNNFTSLPADLQAPGGALDRAYQASMHGNCSVTTSDPCNVDENCPGGETCVLTDANFADGSTRYFTCQTCHMAATGGKGANNGPFRSDLPRHDQTGGISTWIKDAIIHQNNSGTLLFGASGVDETALNAGAARGLAHLQSAASLAATQVGNELKVTVTNLTAHKLISGYPEGRRMFLEIEWYDAGDAQIFTNGEYGPLFDDLSSPVTAPDLTATQFQVESLLAPEKTKVYEAKPAMTRDWAELLLAVGYPSDLILGWDRLTHAPTYTLADLASGSLGDLEKTFHFVLNNAMYADNRIPPYLMDYDFAFERNAAPVPRDQYGGTPDGTYNHWDDVYFPIPVGAVRAEVELYYQPTSWEYIQFLWKQNHRDDGNPGTTPDSFLGDEGVNLLDAWIHTGMAAPIQMEQVAVPPGSLTAPAGNPPGSASGPGQASMIVSGYSPSDGAITLSYDAACDATGHTIHYGSLSDVSTYGWADADCSLDASGTGTFVPTPGVGESIFWVIVGNNSDWESADYGTDSDGHGRPGNTTAAGACLRPQSWVNFCE
jgi:hypothetical protein